MFEAVGSSLPHPAAPADGHGRPLYWRRWVQALRRGDSQAPLGAMRRPASEREAAVARPVSATAPASLDRADLLKAYLASAAEVMRHADALQSDVLEGSVRPVALQALVADVLSALEPTAAGCGLRLYRDTDSRSDGVWPLDALRFGMALRHLVLRTLACETGPGHIRLLTTLAPDAARVIVLSRTPEPIVSRGDDRETGLWAAERLLLSQGGVLEREPRRAGYFPLSIVLKPSPSAVRACAA